MLPRCLNPILNSASKTRANLLQCSSCQQVQPLVGRRVRVRAVKCQVFPCMYSRKCQKLLSGHFTNGKVDSDVYGNEILKVLKRCVCVCMCLNAFTKGSGPI